MFRSFFRAEESSKDPFITKTRDILTGIDPLKQRYADFFSQCDCVMDEVKKMKEDEPMPYSQEFINQVLFKLSKFNSEKHIFFSKKKELIEFDALIIKLDLLDLGMQADCYDIGGKNGSSSDASSNDNASKIENRRKFRKKAINDIQKTEREILKKINEYREYIRYEIRTNEVQLLERKLCDSSNPNVSYQFNREDIWSLWTSLCEKKREIFQWNNNNYQYTWSG